MNSLTSQTSLFVFFILKNGANMYLPFRNLQASIKQTQVKYLTFILPPLGKAGRPKEIPANDPVHMGKKIILRVRVCVCV